MTLKEAIQQPGFAGRWGVSRLFENWDKWNAEHKKGGHTSAAAEEPAKDEGGWQPPKKGSPEYHDQKAIEHIAASRRHKRAAAETTGDAQLAHMEAAAAHAGAADEHKGAARIGRRRDTTPHNHANTSDSAEDMTKKAFDYSAAAHKLYKGSQ